MAAVISSLGALLVLALGAVLYYKRRAARARASRPKVVLALPQPSGNEPVVVNASELSAVELAHVDVVGTTTSPTALAPYEPPSDPAKTVKGERLSSPLITQSA